MSMNVWETSAELLSRHLARAPKLDALLEALPSQLTAVDRRRCRHLIYGAIRHRGLLDHALKPHLRRAPRPRLHAALLLGSFELLEHPENAASIVHHAVDRTRQWPSPAEARMVNAVLRRVAESLPAETARAPVDVAGLARRYSHPAWLVERWIARWGWETARRLLEWNQQPAPVYARAIADASSLPPVFQATAWPEFYRLDRPDWELVEQHLAAGAMYLQDPATSLAPGLLAVSEGETVLDLCAAPGGKTLQLAERVGTRGRVISVDLPGPRLERLRDNLTRRPTLPITVLGADVSTMMPATFAAAGLPSAYDAVLLDAPCSNTGVLRHRVDAKWRIKPEDLTLLPAQQLEMLRRAIPLVRPGGRLVYSTCSLESEENEDVIQRLLAESGPEFQLESAVASLPWESGCDGAGAFLLRRSRARSQ